MRIILLFCLMISSFVTLHAKAAPVEIRITPTRSLEILCVQANRAHVFKGSSDDFKILRVGESVISYEVYRGDFLVASCRDIFIE